MDPQANLETTATEDRTSWEEERAILIAEARAARAAGDQAGRERDDAVAAHRASEEAYRHLTEALPQIVWITRPDGSHVYFNQRWIDYTGLNLEESCGFGWDKLLHPDDRQRRQDRWDEASRTGEAYEIEYRFQGADGGYRWFLGRAMPLRDAQGKIINWLGTCTDIDAQKRAAEALRESQESLNLALGAVHIGTWVWHVQENALRWDERMHDIFGLPRGTFSGTYEAFLSRIHPDDVWHITDKVSRTLAENTSFDIDYRVVWPDGSVHFLTARAAVFRDGSGRPLRMTGMCLDITERKRVEEELVYERYLLHSLMDTIPDSIYFKDRESRFLRVNRSLAERFGFDDPASALGKSDLDLFTEEHARPAYEDEQAIIGTGKPIIAKEEKETWPDGRVTWVSTTKMPLRGAGGSISGTLGISRDITDRKQTEEELYRAKEAAEAANRSEEHTLNSSHRH